MKTKGFTSVDEVRENIHASWVAPHIMRLFTMSCMVSIDGSYEGTVNVAARPTPYTQLRIDPSIRSHPVTLRTFQYTPD